MLNPSEADSKFAAHSGILDAARAIVADLRETGILRALFRYDPGNVEEDAVQVAPLEPAGAHSNSVKPAPTHPLIPRAPPPQCHAVGEPFRCVKLNAAKSAHSLTMRVVCARAYAPRPRTTHHALYPLPVVAHSEGGIHILLQGMSGGRHSAA